MCIVSKKYMVQSCSRGVDTKSCLEAKLEGPEACIQGPEAEQEGPEACIEGPEAGTQESRLKLEARRPTEETGKLARRQTCGMYQTPENNLSTMSQQT